MNRPWEQTRRPISGGRGEPGGLAASGLPDGMTALPVARYLSMETTTDIAVIRYFPASTSSK